MSIARNAVHLYIIQGSNILIPLATLPVLARALGPSGFGIIALAQLVLQYMVMVTDFGFNLTATRRIVSARGNISEISRIFCSTMTVRVGLLAACLLAVVGMLVFLEPSDYHLYAQSLALIGLLGNVMTPAWLFHGTERNELFAAFSISPRLVCLVFLFLFVKGPEDLILAAGLLFLPPFVCGILSLTWAFYRLGLTPNRPTLGEIRFSIQDGFHVFTVSVFSTIYMYLNGFIVKFLYGDAALGIYAAAEKLAKAVYVMVQPAIQAVYPRACAGASAPILKLSVIIAAATALIWCVVLLAGDLIIHVVYGPAFSEASMVLKILTLGPIFTGLAAVTVQLRILASGQHAILKRIYFVSLVFYVAQAYWLINGFAAVGAAISVVATELVTLISVHVMMRRIRDNSSTSRS